MTRRELVLQRDTVQQAAEVMDGIAHDETQSDEARDRAYDVYFALSEVLLYQAPGADGTRQIRLVPLSFGIPGYYSKLIVELERDLGPEVVADNIGRFALARHAAKLVDDALLSIDFRQECDALLSDIVASIKREADDSEVPS